MSQINDDRYSDFTRTQLVALIDHYRQFINVAVEANNELISRLRNSQTFAYTDRMTLNEWSLVMNELYTASEAEVMTIVGAPSPTTAN